MDLNSKIQQKIYCYLLIGLFVLFSSSRELHAAELRQIEINNTTLYYHFCKSTKPSKGLLFFMHGAVVRYMGQTESLPKDLSGLLESNTDLIPACENNGYDLIVPISYNEYNWLDKSGEMYIEKLVGMYRINYPAIYLSGFSDGATGAYRMFYKQPEIYAGVMIFNGYPQLHNYNKQVDYTRTIDRKIIYISQWNDKIIPYEFLLTEYRRQKLTNEATYMILVEGKHGFGSYHTKDFLHCFSLLEMPKLEVYKNRDSICIFPPVDGLIIAGKVEALYPFRKSVARKFGMNASEYELNNEIYTLFKKWMVSDVIYCLPRIISKNDLTNDSFNFTFKKGALTQTYNFKNVLVYPPWGKI